MHLIGIRVSFALALFAAVMGLRSANALDLNQDWVLNSSLSHVYMQTEKLEATIERHQFKSMEGSITKDGDATIKLDLSSLETGIDLRNVRMRFLLFEVFKYPFAVITAKLDKSKLQYLTDPKAPVKAYPLTLSVNMHGVVNEIQTEVWISRTGDDTVSVSTVGPILVTAESFGLTKNVAKLVDAVNGIRIVPSASITFDLVFGSGALKPELEAARAEREKSKAVAEAQPIPEEGCETRFSVISQTGAIYFKTGSAELDRESEPLLNSGADIANRCPSVRFEVEGHTDNVGSERSNHILSEQRAKSVVDYLTSKGVSVSRIQSAGYGETRPVAPNNSEANRAKNRRIEFKVKKS